LVANRAYLDSLFPRTLKKRLQERVELPTPEGKECPPKKAAPPETQEPSAIRARPPLHILNVALNLVGGHNLAWQERKASSFTISPLHSGSNLLGYRDSAEYANNNVPGDGITLGTAMAISGAAVSPNMGAQ